MTPRQRAAFLAELGVSGNVTFACRAAGILRREAYEYRASSPTFERLWRAAEARALVAADARVRSIG